MDIKTWNSEIKRLREIIMLPDQFEESKKLMIELHANVHSSMMSGMDQMTFEDFLWEGLDDQTFRLAVNDKGRTIAYGIWHATRIEDMTMNLLVAKDVQVFSQNHWQERINASIIDTGNSLNASEIMVFSENINRDELIKYRIEVGRRSQEIINHLTIKDMKRKFDAMQLQQLFDEGAVLEVEASRWLVDFWGRKNVAGIILMPLTRHHLVHLNESMQAKKRGKIK